MNEWSQIMPQGTIDNLLKAWAEMGNEYARYLEYLYQEKKFKNARNMSSVTHMTDLIGFKRSLPKSAVGYIVISHTDKNGKNRLQNFGVEFFDLNAPSDYDELIQNKNATIEEKSALVPWTANKPYIIPEGSVITSSNGIKYFVTETVESRSLKEPFSVIKKDPIKYKNFIEAGGWNGIKYLKVPVIQGERVEVQLGESQGRLYESFNLNTLNVENGSNIISSKYLKLRVTPYKKINGRNEEATDESEIWKRVDNIGLAGPYDKVFEIKILDEDNSLLFKFGNGITGKIPPANALITLEYIQTLGKNGNIDNKFQLNTISFPNGYQMVDPRTNVLSNFICCTNTAPINGGQDLESIENIKENAPSKYLESYTTSSKRAYLKQIEKNSPVNLLHTHIFNSEVVETESYGDYEGSDDYASTVNNSILQEITGTKNCLLVCALRSNGEEIEDPETELIEPLTKLLDDYMSPNDSIDFVKPNIIKLCPRIKIGTSSNILENEIYNELRPKIYSEYSLFNRDFNGKFYSSGIVDIAHNLPYTKKVDDFIEAKAVVDLEPTIITKAAQTGIAWLNKNGSNSTSVEDYDFEAEAQETLMAFDFKFDKIFAQNLLEKGFKNYKYNAPYLLKVNITFRESEEDSRTLFLFDNRTSLKDDISVMDAYFEPIDGEVKMPDIINKDSANYGEETIKWLDESSDRFNNVQIRTAQFAFIDNITDLTFMDAAKSFMYGPFEIRPLFINEHGENEIFNVNDVPKEERLSLSFDKNINTTTCYRKNFQYWPHTRIEFYEDYEKSDSTNYARGRIILPMNKVLTATDISSLKVLLKDVEKFDDQTPDIEKMISEKIKIEVFACPVQTTFECNNENDLICVDKDDIQIEKTFLKE